METILVNDLETLRKCLAVYGDGFLFRGQTNDYAAADGTPSLTSSFERKGCIPPLMLKWIFYVDELLRRGGFDVNRPDLMPFTQGLLQHYGWRSFFVDLSSDPAVAAWFSSHSFESQRRLDLCETPSENGVMLVVQAASYKDNKENGHLYVLSKELLEERDHTLVSLVDDLTTDFSSRLQVQKAWLAGVFGSQRRLSPAAISAHITGPASVFRDFARAAGFQATDDLFPPPEQDKLLENLLSLPRERMEYDGLPFPFYRRSLDIPEYQDSFVKHLPVTTALFAPFWLSETEPPETNELWIHVPEETFYGHTRLDQPLPRLSEILHQNDITNIESKNLICYPGVPKSTTFEKGVSVRRVSGNVFEVCGISVDYQGDQLIGGGVANGYRYELVGGARLIRRESPTDCRCGDPHRHSLHLRALVVLNDMLSTAKIERTGNVIQVTSG